MIIDKIAEFAATVLVAMIGLFPELPQAAFPQVPQQLTDFGQGFYDGFTKSIVIFILWRFLSSFLQVNSG